MPTRRVRRPHSAADLLGRVVRVPASEFHEFGRRKFYVGKIVKPDTRLTTHLIVRFDEDGTRCYWPEEQLRKWLGQATGQAPPQQLRAPPVKRLAAVPRPLPRPVVQAAPVTQPIVKDNLAVLEAEQPAIESLTLAQAAETLVSLSRHYLAAPSSVSFNRPRRGSASFRKVANAPALAALPSSTARCEPPAGARLDLHDAVHALQAPGLSADGSGSAAAAVSGMSWASPGGSSIDHHPCIAAAAALLCRVDAGGGPGGRLPAAWVDLPLSRCSGPRLGKARAGADAHASAGPTLPALNGGAASYGSVQLGDSVASFVGWW